MENKLSEHAKELYEKSKLYLEEKKVDVSNDILEYTSRFHSCENKKMRKNDIYEYLKNFFNNKTISVIFHLIRGIDDEEIAPYKGWELHMEALRTTHKLMVN